MWFILDERQDVQKKTFGKWINSQLIKVRHLYTLRQTFINLRFFFSQTDCPLVTDLFYDLRDGTRLLALLSVLTGHEYVIYFNCANC